MISLVTATIPCSLITNPVQCDEGIEFLTVEIHQAGGPLKLYIMYSRPGRKSLDIFEVCTTAAQALSSQTSVPTSPFCLVLGVLTQQAIT